MFAMLSGINSKLSPFIKRLIGFIQVGLLTTITSAGVLYVLLEMLKWQVYFSYTLIYLLSIFISYLLNAKLVFKKAFSWFHLVAFYLTYLSGMLIGLIVISLLKSQFNYSDFVNSCLVLPITIIWNYVFASIIFARLRVSLNLNPRDSLNK